MERTPTLRAAVAVLPASCYENPTWKGLLYFARDTAVYTAAVALLACIDNPLALALLWPLTGLCISTLFVLGHDAAHGALFRSARLNGIVATAGLLPSLHGYSVWVLGHNRIHHVHTGSEGVDFVWHPLSPAAYAALPWFEKMRHRIEWSAYGAGLYYVRAVWWQRMVRAAAPPRFESAFRRDRLLVAAYAAVFSLLCMWLGHARSGTLAGGVWMWLKVGVLPWVCWNYFIGATVYVHHIALDARWFRREQWSRFKGQVLATTNFVARPWYNFFAHNIYLHVPHHVDTRIPFYGLPAAAEALTRHFGDCIHTRPLRLRDYVETTRRCKLYDFERGVWCGYDGQIAVPAIAAPGARAA
jgi:omega-6 fatty acid desaturase (delta-12 desaturase)